MKVIVNAIGYVGQAGGAGGAGVFLQYLIEQLAAHHPVDVLIAQGSQGLLNQHRKARVIELPYLSGETLQHLREGPTVVIDPFGALPCAPFPEDLALCVVVHDLMHLERPHFFTAAEREGRSRSFAAGLQRADAVVTFSADQARAVRRFYPGTLPVVVPHLPYAALEPAPAAPPGSDIATLQPFLLFPAVKWPHKNHRTVIAAFDAFVRSTGSSLRLVLCGGPCAESRFSFYPDSEHMSDRIVDLGHVGNAMLGSLLEGATAILFPTLYEGFGIPVLEAAFLGKMVVASKLPVFDEILGASGYRSIDDPLCELRWMAAFAEAERSDKRRDYEAASQRSREKIDPGRFLARFTDVLKTAADRYSDPSLYPVRGFRGGDRATSALADTVAFADIYNLAQAERGARYPAIGEGTGTASSLIFRCPDHGADRRVCLRADYRQPNPAPDDRSPLVFSCWLRLRSESGLDALCWSVSDGDVVNLLPILRDGEWHLFRRQVPDSGFIDLRATRDGATEAAGFDIEIHNPCLLRVAPMSIPVPDETASGLTIIVDALSGDPGLQWVVADIAAVENALPAGGHRPQWMLLIRSAAIEDPAMQPAANVRVRFVDARPFERADATRLVSPYDPVDKLLLLSATDLTDCLGADNLKVLGSAIGHWRMGASGRLTLDRDAPSLWLADERGRIMDVRSRTGMPIPFLDREVIATCLTAEGAERRPRFAVIETDLTGGISHHGVVTGLFLDGARACGFDVCVGLNIAAVPSEDEPVDSWPGFGAQVYQPGDADDFARELSAFVGAQRLGSGDLVFMHSLSPQILLGVARFIAAHPATAPRFAVRLFSTAEAMAGHRLSYTKILQSIRSVRIVRERMHVFCESENLIAYYEEEVGERYPLLLNPEHPALTRVRSSGWYDPGLGAGRHPTLAYFGEARAEKGFDHIPRILEALLADPAMDPFRFMIQIGSNTINRSPEMAHAKAALQALKTAHRDRVRTFESAETPEEFYFLMKHATGVISPYRADAYGRRGTGVTLEALQMGLDVFAWADTDLYATFRHTGHVIGVQEGEDFARVIASHYGSPRTALRRGVESLRQSPALVCERLLSLCQPDPSEAGPPRTNTAPVLWVGNDTFGEGCSAVYAAQKTALRQIGRDCLELFVPWPDRNRRGADGTSRDATAYGFDSRYEGQGLAWVARPDYTGELERVLDLVETAGPTYARLRDLNTHMIIPETLKAALAANGVSQTVLNYVHLHPVIADVVPIEGIVCETHDVVAYQHAVRRGTGVSLTEKIDEFSDMARFRAVIAISAAEQREMASACPASEVFWRLPPYDPEGSARSVGAGDGQGGVDDFGAGGGPLSAPDDILELVAQPSPLMLSVYQSRPDLRARFDLGRWSGRFGFFQWWVFFGHRENTPRFGFTRNQYLWLIGDLMGADTVPGLGGLLTLILSFREDLRVGFMTPGGLDLAGLQAWEETHAAREFGISRDVLMAAAHRHFAALPQHQDGESSALMAVALAGPSIAGTSPAEQHELFERIHRLGAIDMVLVGSGHPANIVSFEWFVTKVFAPFLAPAGRNLFIAGSACAALRHHEHPALVLLGRCERIEPLLRASRTCPVPVVSGSGSPIKTIPALAVNGAVTVTEHIDKAFGFAGYGIPSFSDPTGFADDLRLLMTNEAARDQRIAAARRYVDEQLSVPGYVEFWRQRLEEREPARYNA